MRVLVTGAGGFIGGHLARALAEKGHAIRVFDLESTPLDHLRDLDIEVCRGDLRDPDSLKEPAAGVDAVYHLGSLVTQVATSREDYLRTNLRGTLALLEAVRGARFVFSSSVAVYGPLPALPADETTPCSPDTVYGESKLAAEKRVLEAGGTAARLTWVYGPRDRRTVKFFRAIRRRRFLIVGNGKTWVHPVHVSDVVRGLTLCGEKENARGRVYVLGGDTPISLAGLVSISAGVLGVGVPRLRLPVLPMKALASLCEFTFRLIKREPPLHRRRLGFFLLNQWYDISRARGELGYEPRSGLDEGLRETIGWYEREGWL